MQETQTALLPNYLFFLWQSISHSVILHCFSAPRQMQQEVQHQIATSPCVAPWWATAAQHFGGARLCRRLHHKTFLKDKSAECTNMYRIGFKSHQPEFPVHFFEKMSRFECGAVVFFGGSSNDIRSRNFCFGQS